MKHLSLLLAAALSGPNPAFAAALEAQAFEARRALEPQIPAEDLERHLIAQNETRGTENEHRQAPDVRRLNKKQKQQFIGAMAAGGLLGAITGGVFGALVGIAAGGCVWFLLTWAEVI